MSKELTQVEIITISNQQLEALLDAKVKLILDAISQANSKSDSDQWFDLKALIVYLPSRPKSQTVYEWVNKKIIPYHKTQHTKMLTFLKSEIDEWLKTGRRKTQADKSTIVSNYLFKTQSKKYKK